MVTVNLHAGDVLLNRSSLRSETIDLFPSIPLRWKSNRILLDFSTKFEKNEALKKLCSRLSPSLNRNDGLSQQLKAILRLSRSDRRERLNNNWISLLFVYGNELRTINY